MAESKNWRPIFGRLVELYRREGIEICSGLPPPHFKGLGGTNFTWFLKGGENLTLGLGIAPTYSNPASYRSPPRDRADR
jgi:hypothetical protein